MITSGQGKSIHVEVQSVKIESVGSDAIDFAYHSKAVDHIAIYESITLHRDINLASVHWFFFFLFFFIPLSSFAYVISSTPVHFKLFNIIYPTALASCQASFGGSQAYHEYPTSGPCATSSPFLAGRTYDCKRVSDNACFTSANPVSSCPSGFILSNSDGSPTSDERAFFCSQPDATCTPPLILQPNNTCANNVVCIPQKF